MNRPLATSALALILGAGTALADVTPAEVWQSLQDSYEQMGYAVQVGSEDASDEAITLTDVVLTVDGEADAPDMVLTLPEIVLTAVGNGTGREDSLKYRATRTLETRAVRRADAVAVICEGLRGDLIARGIDPAKIFVSPNGVDMGVFGDPLPYDQPLATKLGVSGADTIGFIGSFYDYEGLDVLIEVHDEAELERALTLRSRLIGCNNRDLRDFSVEVTRSYRLKALVPADCTFVAESGLSTRADLDAMAAHGVHCFLIGEALMRQPDVEAATRAMVG